MKRISLSEAINYLSKKFLGYDPIEFFEKARDKRSLKVKPLDMAWLLVDIYTEVENFEQQTYQKVESLEREVQRLRKILNKDPSNSHKPPSSEKNKKKIKNSRTSSQKPPGGQPGHEGETHELHNDPDVIHRCDIHKCIECGASLKNVDDHEVIRKQLIDIKEGKQHITEYQRVIKYCPQCGRWNRADEPVGIQKSRIVFGPNVKSVAIYFSCWQLLPFWRVQQVFWDLYAVSISQSSLCNFVREYGEKLNPWEAEATQKLLDSPVINADETGIRCNKKNEWIHVICNENWTLLKPHIQRGTKAIEDIGILPEYNGHLVHDAFASYWRYGKTHSLCNAHILRELKFLHEEDGQKWAKSMADFLNDCLKGKKGEKRKLSKNKILSEYTNILKKGFKENGFTREWKGRPPDGYKKQYKNMRLVKVPVYRRRKHSDAMNLLNRLRDRKQEVLAFALKKDIPFTNNIAERAFRMAKLKEKISGCFRSRKMAEAFLRVRSYMDTMTKQDSPLLENLVFVEICC